FTMLTDRRCLHRAIIDIAFAAGFWRRLSLQSRVPPALRRDAIGRARRSDCMGAEVMYPYDQDVAFHRDQASDGKWRGRIVMICRRSSGAFGFAGAVMVTIGAQAADDAKYPDWSGAWMRIPVRLPTQPSHDQTKPWGRGQQAPLTPEYQKVLEDSIADQAIGGLGNFPTTLGRAAGMPHMMMGFGPLEVVVTPPTTYILIGWYDHYRRIFTDGRDWPKEIEPTFAGYSIGRWVDEDGDGRYDVLEVETRGF